MTYKGNGLDVEKLSKELGDDWTLGETWLDHYQPTASWFHNCYSEFSLQACNWNEDEVTWNSHFDISDRGPCASGGTWQEVLASIEPQIIDNIELWKERMDAVQLLYLELSEKHS